MNICICNCDWYVLVRIAYILCISVEHPSQSFSQIVISDEDDPHQVSQDAGLLCYAELLYRCRLCRSQNASDTLVFKHSHNFLLHLRTCHWLIVQHASATLREHDTTQECVAHQEKHSGKKNRTASDHVKGQWLNYPGKLNMYMYSPRLLSYRGCYHIV